MSEREANIKLKLNAAQFKSGIRSAQSQTEQSGRKMGSGLKEPIVAGLRASKDALGDLISTTKTAVTYAVTLGGAFGFAEMAKGAISASISYRQLAGNIERISGVSQDVVEVQHAIEKAADGSASSLEETRMNAQLLASAAGGDTALLADFLQAAQLQAKRLGTESEIVANVYSRLVAKGIATSAEEAERLVERMALFGQGVLGLQIDEAIDPNDMSEFAAFVNQANANVDQMITLLANTGSAAKDLGGAIEIVEELGLVFNTTKGLDDLRKTLHLSKKDINLEKGSIENLFTALEKGGPKAFSKIQGALGTDRARKALEELVTRELAIKIEGGKVDGGEYQARLDLLKKSIKESAGAGVDRAKVDEQNAAMTENSAAKFQRAMNKIEKSFQDPKVIGAMDKLADSLPKLAEAIGDLVGFIADNPLLSGGLAVGAKVGMPFLGQAVPGIAKAAFSGSVASVGAAGAAASAGELATRAALGGADAAKTGEAIAAAATAGSRAKWAAAGKHLAAAGGVALAAAAAYELGKQVIDVTVVPVRSKQELFSQGVNAVAGNDIEAKKAALERFKAERAAKISEGPGAMNRIFSKLGESVGLVGGNTGVATADEAFAKNMTMLATQILELEDSIKKTNKANNDATNAQNRQTQAALRSARAMEKQASEAQRVPGGGPGAEKGPASLGAPRAGSNPMPMGS